MSYKNLVELATKIKELDKQITSATHQNAWLSEVKEYRQSLINELRRLVAARNE